VGNKPVMDIREWVEGVSEDR